MFSLEELNAQADSFNLEEIKRVKGGRSYEQVVYLETAAELQPYVLYLCAEQAQRDLLLRTEELETKQMPVGIVMRRDSGLYAAMRALAMKCQTMELAVIDSALDWEKLQIKMLSAACTINEVKYREYVQVNESFMRLSVKNRGVEAMIGYLKGVIGNPVAIYDEAFHCIASTDEFPSFNASRVKNSVTKHLSSVYYSRQTLFLDDGETNATLLSFPISYRSTVRAYLSVLERDRRGVEKDYMTLEIAAAAILTEMKHLFAMQSLERRNCDRFLYDLLYCGELNEAAVSQQAETIGVHMQEAYAVAALHVNVDGPLQERPVILSTVLYPNRQEDALFLIVQHMKTAFPKALVGSVNEDILMLLPASELGEDGLIATERLCDELRGLLAQYFRKVDLRAGIGGIMQGVDGLRESRKQAAYALQYSVNHFKNNLTVRYEDNLALKLVGCIQNAKQLREMIPQQLFTIMEYDRRHDGNMLESLSVYLSCDCNAKAAAEKLFIHHKTMFFRLNKMEELFHLHLGDGEAKMELMLGMQLIRIIQNQRPDFFGPIKE